MCKVSILPSKYLTDAVIQNFNSVFLIYSNVIPFLIHYQNRILYSLESPSAKFKLLGMAVITIVVKFLAFLCHLYKLVILLPRTMVEHVRLFIEYLEENSFRTSDSREGLFIIILG